MEKSKARDILIITCVAYFSFGLLWSSIGPLLSQFAARNETTLASIGAIFSAVFLGAVTSQIVFGPFSDRWGLLRSLTIALLVFACAITAASFSTWLPLTFLLAFISGLGHGMTSLCGNVMIGRIYKTKSVSAISLLNVFWGTGAFVGPLLVSGAIYVWQNGYPALWFSAILMVISALILLVRFFNIHVETSEPLTETSSQKRIQFNPFLLSMGGLLLLYVGTESAMGGWTTTYILKTTTLSIELAAMVTSGFWLALTLGMVIAAFLGVRLKAKHVLMLSLAIAALGTVLFVTSFGNSLFSIVSIFLIGLGYGAVYPTGMAMVTNAFPEKPGQAGSVITSMCSIGGMIIPWLLGTIMQRSGIRAGTYLITAVMALMLVLFALNQWLGKKRDIF